MGFNTPYGYDFKAEGDGTYGLGGLVGASDSFWNRPTNYDQWANPSFGVESLNTGGTSGTASTNPFGNLFKSGFGTASPMSNPMTGFNMSQMLAASAGIASARDSAERQLDYNYGMLANELGNKYNVEKWYKYGPLLKQQEQNLGQRDEVSNKVLSKAFMNEGITSSLSPRSWSANGGLNSVLPGSRLV